MKPLTPKYQENEAYVNSLLDDAYTGRTNNLQASIKLAKQALEISKKNKNQPLIGKSLNQLSLYHMIIGEFETSNNYSKEAILCFEAIGDDIGVANAKYNLGSVLYRSDNYHGGLVYLLDTLAVYKKHNDLTNITKVEKAVGTIYEYIGDDENAFKTYKSAIRTARQVGDVNFESNVFNNLSGLLLKRNKSTIAMRMITYAIDLKKQTNDLRGLGFSIYGRGKVYLNLKQFDNAENDFLEALQIHEKYSEKLGAAMVLRKLGELYYEIKEYESAELVIKKSAIICEKYNVSMVKNKNFHLLYLIYKDLGNTLESLKYLELYLHEKEAIMEFQTLKVIENYKLINQMNNLEHEAKIRKEKQKAIDKKNEHDQKALLKKQEFLSIMSHEIRTPLNAITTIATLLNRDAKEKDKELFDSLLFSSNNLIAIVNDLLDFTKLESNKATIEKHVTNFNELCVNIYNLHLNQAKAKDLQFILKNNIPNRNYLLDQTKVSQILDNLIGNAIKFTNNGSITLTATLEKESTTHDSIHFSIRDTGEGITKSGMKKVFDSFTQIKPITTRKEGGTGLGLAIVKRLVALLGGQVKVRSEIGKGAEFYFTISFEKTLLENKVENIDYSSLKNLEILVAEDNAINAMLIKKILLDKGIKVDHAVNGFKAVEAAKNKKYDCILMDIHMPEMNGFDAAKLIRTQDSINEKTLMFAVTADVLTNHKIKGAYLFDDILWKPLEPKKLFTALMKQTVEV